MVKLARPRDSKNRRHLVVFDPGKLSRQECGPDISNLHEDYVTKVCGLVP